MPLAGIQHTDTTLHTFTIVVFHTCVHKSLGLDWHYMCVHTRARECHNTFILSKKRRTKKKNFEEKYKMFDWGKLKWGGRGLLLWQSPMSGLKFPHTFAVASDTSRIIFSNAAVSSACFWLCNAIFSLNFLGFAIFFLTSSGLWCRMFAQSMRQR